MKKYALFVFGLLVSGMSLANSCMDQKEEQKSGAFEVLSVSEVRAKCVRDGSSLFSIKRGSVKVDGCSIEFKAKSGAQDTFRAYMTGNSCKVGRGTILNRKFQTIKNTCCGIRAQFGRMGPLCTGSSELKIIPELSEQEKMCMADLVWWEEKSN